jgi:hypothetical protein
MDRTTRLEYAGRRAAWHPARHALIGALSVLFGAWGVVFNLFLAATMAKELGKQWFGRMKGLPLPVQAWLAGTAAEAAASAVLAAVLVAAGAATLRRPGRAAALHRRYARVKLVLAAAFAGCAGLAVMTRVSAELDVVAAAAGLALIASAAYPVVLLRTFRGEGEEG